MRLTSVATSFYSEHISSRGQISGWWLTACRLCDSHRKEVLEKPMIQRSHMSPEPRAQSALAESGIHSLRQLSVAQIDNRLCIRGSVGSYYHKQMAQQLVLSVAEGMEVINSITVVAPLE
jgi:hypothetical protein